MGSTSDTYHPIPTICVFTAPQRVAMNVGNNGASVRYVIPDLRNDCVGSRNIAAGVGNDGAGVRSVMVIVRNGYMCVFPKLGLGAEN